jgi:ElaB/YqjD/DUF883 family membrane-anchored ribosome-binding protein
MNTTANSFNPGQTEFGERAAEAADKVGDTADNAIDRTRRLANDALDSAADTVDEVREKAEPTVRRLATQAETLARRGMDAVRDGSQQLREQATEMTDRTTRYVKDEPLKAVLMAAAAGAALMAVLTVVARSGESR